LVLGASFVLILGYLDAGLAQESRLHRGLVVSDHRFDHADLEKVRSDQSLNWGNVVLYVGFLSALAAVVTPGIDPNARSAMNTLLFMSLGAIMVRTGFYK
jgi:hypothetical protein